MSHKIFRILIVTFLFLGCGTPLQFSGDYRETTLPEFHGEIADHYKLSAINLAEPVILDSVHTAWLGAKGEILVFDHDKNDEVKKYKGKEDITAMSVNDSLILWIESEGRKQIALFNMHTDDQLWRVAGPPSAVSPVLTDTTAIIIGVNGAVSAYSVTSGKQQWTSMIKGRVFVDPVLLGDEVIVGTAEGRIISLNQGDGSQNWSAEIGKPVLTMSVKDSVVYLGTQTGHMIAYDLSARTNLWDIQTYSQVTHEPLIRGDSIYWTNSMGEIRKINLNTGVSTRLAVMQVPPAGSLVLSAGGLLFPGKDGQLYLVDQKSGKILSRVDFQDHRLRSAPLYIQDRWYITAEDHWMYELH